MKYKKNPAEILLSRRTFLRGTGGAAIALPFLSLPSLIGSKALAQRTKRFVTFATSTGICPEQFWPVLAGAKPNDFDAPTVARYVSGRTYLNTRDFSMSRTLEPLKDFKNQMLIIEGLDHSAGNHGGYASMLTGGGKNNSGGGTSIDQLIAQKISSDRDFASLQLGVRVFGTNQRQVVSWYNETEQAPAESSPYEVFDRVFKDVQLAQDDPDAFAKIQEEKRSILDGAIRQMERIKKPLALADQRKLDEHMDSIRDVEKRLSAGGAIGCQVPTVKSGLNIKFKPEQTPDLCKAQIDLMVMALACDLTRVATFQLLEEGSAQRHPWLKVDGKTIEKDWHSISHSALDDINGQHQIVEINKWQTTQLAYLAQRLQDNGILNDTCILWRNGLTKGTEHHSENTPIVLIGSAGGALKTGRYIRYEYPEKRQERRRANDLLLTLLQAYGVNRSSIGIAEYNRGPLDEIRT